MSDTKKLYSVSDVYTFETNGPWKSKSGGELTVLFSLDFAQSEQFLGYDNPEFARIETTTSLDIKGLRVYNVSSIPNGSTGAMEYHLARTEIVTVLSGGVKWTCEDVYGEITEHTLDTSRGLVVPPSVMHTYTALEDDTRLQVVCNTLFYPDDPRTHDSYSFDDFRQLQKIVQQGSK